jgi:galactokinase/mevalonate kinase-like predicted kinase
MGAVMFYIPTDLMFELTQVANRSELITNLLREHFSKGKPLEELKAQKIKESQSLLLEAKKIDKEIIAEKEEKLKQEQEAKRLLEIEDKEKEAERKQDQYNRFKDIFLKNWDINKENIDSLVNEFIQLIKEDKVKNIIEFMELKQIKRKEKKNG